MMSRFTYVFLGIFILMFGFKTAQSQTQKWFPKYDFEAPKFKSPSQAFGPMARWWWSGNDVNKTELQREINVFADNAFTGVEIQTLYLGIPLNAENRLKIMSWDSPEYYENVKTVMMKLVKEG